MKKCIIFILFLLLNLTTSSVLANDFNKQQQHFVQFILPIIEKANHDIAKTRSKLLMLESKNHLSNKQKQWVNTLAQTYQINNFKIHNKNDWQQLVKKVDIVPTSLVLAQAINESAWGHSRFAKQGNNYFGQWCSTPGCGIVPKHRPKGATYEVRKFVTPLASVNTYLHNLNTHRAYASFRTIRAKLRSQDKPLKGLNLAAGLVNYSSRGEKYVHSIQNIITNYNLAVLSHEGQTA